MIDFVTDSVGRYFVMFALICIFAIIISAVIKYNKPK